MSVRRIHLAFLAAAVLPFVGACGDTKRPVDHHHPGQLHHQYPSA